MRGADAKRTEEQAEEDGDRRQGELRRGDAKRAVKRHEEDDQKREANLRRAHDQFQLKLASKTKAELMEALINMEGEQSHKVQTPADDADGSLLI